VNDDVGCKVAETAVTINTIFIRRGMPSELDTKSVFTSNRSSRLPLGWNGYRNVSSGYTGVACTTKRTAASCVCIFGHR
jgi:hypothetical protein